MKLKKYIAATLAGFMVLVVSAYLALTPSVMRNMVLRALEPVESKLGIKVKIGSIFKSLFLDEFQVNALQVFDENARVICDAQSLLVKTSLSSFLLDKSPVLSVHVDKADINLDISQLSSSKQSAQIPEFFLQFATFSDTSIRIFDREKSIGEFQQVDLQAHFNNRHIFVSLAVLGALLNLNKSQVNLDTIESDFSLTLGKAGIERVNLDYFAIEDSLLKFLADGQIDFNSDIELNIALESKLESLAAYFDLPVMLASRFNLNGQLLGKTQDISDCIFDGHIDLNHLQLDDMSFESVQAEFIASKHGLTLNDAIVDIGGAKAEVFFDMALGSNFDFVLQVKNQGMSLYNLLDDIDITKPWIDLQIDTEIIGFGQFLPHFDLWAKGSGVAQKLNVKGGPVKWGCGDHILKTANKIDFSSCFHVDTQAFRFVGANFNDGKSEIDVDCSLFFEIGKGMSIDVDAKKLDFASVANDIVGIKFDGFGIAAGKIDGPYEDLVIDINTQINQLEIEKFLLGDASTNVKLNSSCLSFEDSKLNIENSHYKGYVKLEFGKSRKIYINAHSDRFSANHFAKFLPEICHSQVFFGLKKAALDGELNWHAAISGPLGKLGRKKWQGNVEFAFLQSGSVFDVPFSNVYGQAKIIGDKFTIPKLTIDALGGSLEAQFQVDIRNEDVNGFVKLQDIKLNKLSGYFFKDKEMGGVINFASSISGKLSALDSTGVVNASGLKVNGIDLGALSLKLASSNGIFSLKGPLLDGKSNVKLKFGQQKTMPFELQIDLMKFPLSKMVAFGGENELASGFASAQISLNGELQNIKSSSGFIKLSQLELSFQDIHLKLQKESLLQLKDWYFHTDNLLMKTSKKDKLKFSGRVGEDFLETKIEADGSLEILSLIFPEIDKASGTLKANLHAWGSLVNPKFRGNIVGVADKVSFASFEPMIENLEFEALLNKREIEIIKLHGLVGDEGLVDAKGSLELRNLSPYNCDVKIFVEKLPLRVPLVASALIDGEFELKGKNSFFVLGGQSRLFGARVFREVAWEQKISESFTKISLDSKSTSRIAQLRFDVDFSFEDPINIDVENLKAVLNGNLGLRGSIEKPALNGTLDLLFGEATFRNQIYKLQKARLDFNESQGVVPYLAALAETRIKEYEISVGFNGLADDPSVKFSSQPELPSIDVLSLLTLGFTGVELKHLQGGTATTAGLEVLGMYAGLEKQLKKILPDILKQPKKVNIDELRLTSFFSEKAKVTLPAFLMGIELFDGIKMRLRSALADGGSGSLEKRLDIEQKIGQKGNLGWRMGWNSEGKSNFGDAGADFWYKWNL